MDAAQPEASPVLSAVTPGKRFEMAGETLVVILASFAERYVSTMRFEGL